MPGNMTDNGSRTLSIGRDELILEQGRVARQADGSVIVRQGRAAILVTVVSADSPREGVDFFPLTVDYRELFGAAGVIPHSYNRREGRLSDHEILSSRIIDRSLRPLFPDGYRHDTQVVATLLSADDDVDTDVLGLLGACAAIHLSQIPFRGPAAGIRLCRIDDRFVVNPRKKHRVAADIDLVIAAGREGLVMMEGHCREVSEQDVLKALIAARDEINGILDVLDEWRTACAVTPRPFDTEPCPEGVMRQAEEWLGSRMPEALAHTGKQDRHRALRALKNDFLEGMEETVADDIDLRHYSRAFDTVKYRTVRDRIFKDGVRLDQRRPADVRSISGAVDWVPGPHGSALFTRGETQACVTCTLGPERDRLRTENIYGTQTFPFFLHYSFPPYSVGEVRPIRGPGRRETGHGMLAWKALSEVMPDPGAFPYSIRVFSEITESNGSSSMATVCGGCLALMDAGVPVRSPVAGVAMGMVARNDDFVILTDILGDEDHLGDMDFKVAGTGRGITAIQMDNKIGHLPDAVLSNALERARSGLNHILEKMKAICTSPRTDLKPHTPRVEQFYIRENKIGMVIGPSGSVIKDIQNTTGATIDIAENGLVTIYAGSLNKAHDARRRVEWLSREPKLNGFYRGTVKSIKPFGVFVEILPGTEGLVHVSELDTGHVRDPGDICRIGDVIPVKVTGVDNGRLKLSRKDALNVSETVFDESINPGN